MRIGISHDFFAKGLRDYENWKWAFCREIAQNTIDCGSDNLWITITLQDDGNTLVIAENDGPPMDEDTLLTKFLCLGGTTKTFEDTVGGFGVAKTVIALAHKSYKIETGDNLIVGSGGEFEHTNTSYFHGTRTTVVMEGDQAHDIRANFEKFAFWAQWGGTLTVNGEELETSHRKGSPRRDLGFGKVYTNRSRKYVVCVRINGIPMFTTSSGLDRCVIVELKGNSDEVLTANRDGMISPYRGELSSFITELAVDKRSALKDRSRGPRYKEYRGTKLYHRNSLDVVNLVSTAGHPGYPNGIELVKPETIDDGASSGIDVIDGDEVHGAVYSENVDREQPLHAADYGVGAVQVRRSAATLGHNFVLKNETDLRVPSYYDPGSGEFSSYSTKLVRFWGRIMIELHRMFDTEAEFSIGFIFDDSSEAEYEEGDYGNVYYLNPCEVVEQRASYSKSFKKRWKFTGEGKKMLIAIGAHEFVHGLGFGWHSEDFACKYTDIMGRVLAHVSRFSWCFK